MVKAIINDFAENCYVLADKASKKAYIIDPGSNYKAMKDYLKSLDLKLVGVLLTHGHYDHIGGLNMLLEEFSAPIYIHKDERDFLFDPNLNLSGMMADKFKLKDKHRVHTYDEVDTFELGNDLIKVIHTPGHTRGSVSFSYQDMLFSGDCLFKETIGRTDLPTGNQNVLFNTIQKLYKTFDSNTLVYPGHGSFTTIAHEKLHNQFVRSAK